MLVKVLFNLSVTDTQTGIKLFRREVLERVLPQVTVNRYAFDLAVLLNASKAGYRIVEAPVELSYQFSSQVKAKAIWDIFLDTMILFYRTRIRPAKAG